MVYSVTVRGTLSYKQDISDLHKLLADQQSTYAIMRYSRDIPSKVYSNVMSQLSCEVDKITYKKLRDLVKKFIKASGCVIVMDEELESSVYIDPKTGKVLTEDQIEEIDGIPHIKDDPSLFGVIEDDEDDGCYDSGAVVPTLKMLLTEEDEGEKFLLTAPPPTSDVDLCFDGCHFGHE